VKHYLALAEEAEPELTGPRQGAWLERLEREHGNFSVALRWVLDPEREPSEERAELGLRLTVALWQFWNIRGTAEGHRWVETALEKSRKKTAARARALNGAGWMSLWRGDYNKAISLLEEGISLFRELGDTDNAAISLAYLGMTAVRQADEGRMTALRDDAEALRQEPLGRRALAELLFFLAAVASYEGDCGRTIAFLEGSLAAFRELEDARGVSRCVVSIGIVSIMAHDYERAEAVVKEGLESVREVGDRPGTSFALLVAAALAGFREEPERAARLWGAAEDLREAIGVTLGYQDLVTYDYEGHVATARSQLDEAAWTVAWAEGRAMTPEQAIEYALSGSHHAGTEPLEPKVGAPSIDQPLYEPLTARELEVLGLISDGLSNQQIAARLFIAVSTVKTYVNAIFKKLEVKNRTQAVAQARKLHLISE
jgi:DNA-binding CsgD family transcriptional regulator/tetratricopeptide (TPR) repeat protein